VQSTRISVEVTQNIRTFCGLRWSTTEPCCRVCQEMRVRAKSMQVRQSCNISQSMASHRLIVECINPTAQASGLARRNSRRSGKRSTPQVHPIGALPRRRAPPEKLCRASFHTPQFSG
jgi:hypothetical protein